MFYLHQLAFEVILSGYNKLINELSGCCENMKKKSLFLFLKTRDFFLQISTF